MFGGRHETAAGAGAGAGSNRYLRSSLAVAVRPAFTSRRWTLSSPDAPNSESLSKALQGRLEEILIMELHRDGARSFLQLSVRGLYKHVMAAITAPLHSPKPHVPINNNVSNWTCTSDSNVTVPVPVPAKKSSNYLYNAVGVDNSSSSGDSTSSESMGNNNNNSKVRVRQVSFLDHPGGTSTCTVDEEQEPPTSLYRRPDHPHPNEEITYRERIGGYLHPRDMRRLVTPFSASNEPALIVRRHVILLNFDPLRAVILRDRLLVLVPHGADSLLSKLENHVRQGSSDGMMDASMLAASTTTTTTGTHVGANVSCYGTSSEEGDFLQDSSHDGGGTSTVTPSNINRSKLAKDLHRPTKGKSETDSSTDDINNNDDDDDDDAGESDTSFHSEWDEINAKKWIDLPFELQCSDAVLSVVCSILMEDAFALQEEALAHVAEVVEKGKFRGGDPLTGLRHTKDRIREMMSRIKGFVQSLNRILDDDEDMALMNLSRLLTHPERFIKPVSPEILEEEADEPELILEAHLQIGLTLMNALDLLQGQVDSASDLVDQKLDSVRNRILFADMIISILTMCVTGAAVIGSFFGMNVPNHHEEDDTIFFYICVFSSVGSLALVLITLAILFYTRAVPFTGLSG